MADKNPPLDTAHEQLVATWRLAERASLLALAAPLVAVLVGLGAGVLFAVGHDWWPVAVAVFSICVSAAFTFGAHLLRRCWYLAWQVALGYSANPEQAIRLIEEMWESGR